VIADDIGADDCGAGVDGGFAVASMSGFGFIFVIRKEILAPDMFGSHSRKLYDGKCSKSLLPSSNEKTSGL
jgi:hypothetical protein